MLRQPRVRYLLLFAIVFMLLILLSGCSKSPKNERGILKDLQESGFLFSLGGELDVNGCDITKRRTDTSNFSDVIYLDVFACNDDIDCTLSYIMYYELYNDGWVLEKVERDYEGQWRVAPLHGMTDEQLQAKLDYYISMGWYDTVELVDRDTNLTDTSCTETAILLATKDHLYGDEQFTLTQTWYFDAQSCNYTSVIADPEILERSLLVDDAIVDATWNNLARYYGTYDIFVDTFDVSIENLSADVGLMLVITKKDTWSAYWNRLDAAPETSATIICPHLIYFENLGEFGISLSSLNGVLYDSNDSDNFGEADYFILDLDKPGQGKIKTMYGSLETISIPIKVANESTTMGNGPEKDLNLTEDLYSGTAISAGFGGPLTVTVFVDRNEIISEICVEHNETAGVGSTAVKSLKESLIGNSTIGVDAVTGATITSKSFISAAKEAYIIACAKSLGLASYDEQNPLCGIWRWESNDPDLEHAIWCIFPNLEGRWYLIEDDTDDEDAYKLFDLFEFTYMHANNFIIIEGQIISYNWLNNDAFSLIAEGDDGYISNYYYNAYRIPFD